jgi:Cyclic nucleotide-binding domain
MNTDNSELHSMLDRLLSQAPDSLSFTKQLLEILFTPGKFSFDALYSHLEQFFLASINFANFLALLGAIFFVATLLMRTIVPLRISAIISDIFFVGYGVLAHSVTTFILYLLLLPINVVRLYQMLKLVKKARASAEGNLSMDWLKPFMTRRNYRRGDLLFRKGEQATEMFFTVTGRFLVKEINIELSAGRILGELGFLSPDNQRTQTVECIEDGTVLTISYERLLELYFQNPEFGYYFLRLTSERLLQNIARLEATVEEYKARLEANTAKV